MIRPLPTIQPIRPVGEFQVPAWVNLIGVAGMTAGVYHGYKRNNSIMWGLVWGAAGSFFPLPTVVIAIAQGFGKRK